MIPQLGLTLVIYSCSFIVLFPIEAPIYTLLMGPFGIVAAWYSILSQAGALSLLIVNLFLMPHIQRVAYDAVLSREFADDVVLMAKIRRAGNVPLYIRVVRYVLMLPDLSSLPNTIAKAVAIFILNFIPVIGPVFTIVIQSGSRGLQGHQRYFQLKGYTRRQKDDIFRAHRAEYMGFGIAALILELIPVINLFLVFTNTIGAALWAVDIERKTKARETSAEECCIDPLQ
ncbi:uncharacterized protein SPAPADRAFT_148043 [Spathaspora passalidarum NRRL Y-27907]|uniref:Outer spore wall protein RRT8 n=1 Tax=Spathaspora passalidarum (strain NRRL Y-27907 / 11-Y1) TaxID=619300 RepID=G3AJG7_SPAPN|nr:uncharacterized protein SPAPADRAFT_148043 [Spathaspora passalidarum NRRL Y-27907]EGW33869.1 hypothetical protein SPAPADRAFT_148043 [Spathaspora passalidarum NRRL Y-27907]